MSSSSVYILPLLVLLLTLSFGIDVPFNTHIEAGLSQAYPNIPKQDLPAFWKILNMHHGTLSGATGHGIHNLRAIPDFSCVPYGPSNSTPTNVNNVRPGDITVIGAMGDSLTAAFGALAYWPWDVTTEYRGVSWSIGGDETITQGRVTLPNILKLYNPNIKGFAIGTGKADQPDARLDRAVTGSRAPAMLSQALDLIDKIQEMSNVNIDEDWKMITIWVGSNDLCDVCNFPELYSPENYEANIRAAIGALKHALPRVFLNLIQGLNPTMLYGVDYKFCSLLHQYECPCGASDDASIRDMVNQTLAEYNKRLGYIAEDPSLNSNNFTIVVQPFLTKTSVPKLPDGDPDMSYFALDCFHFSGLAHEAAAVGLWNNLFQPVLSKTQEWVPGEKFLCPHQDQVLYTSANSK